ncbi:fructose-bisphosphatase class II, partial [Methylobacterium crusticola]|uniref:fructose-bisphosphatase class II n=1 Tax=Methylobacterium crusticola TaxID=1697972 RepID=UPI0034D73C4A
MGSGGDRDGASAGAAVKCLGGEIQRGIVPQTEEERERLKAMGGDEHRIYKTEDLAPGKEIVFAATGITDGDILEG